MSRLPEALLLAAALALTGAAGGGLEGAAGQEASDAAVRIQGTVVDASSGEALPGARVEVDGRPAILTDAEGRFSFEALPLGEYDLTVDREGYETLAGSLDVLRPGRMTLPLRRNLGLVTEGGAGRLVGQVVDAETGRPIADVRVTVVETGESRVTDGGGRFSFGRSSPGTYGLVVERLGYRSGRREVRLRPEEALHASISISPDPVPLEGIEVEVDARSLPLQDAGFYDRRITGMGKFLTGEEIEERRAMRVTDVLRELPGVRIVPSPLYPNGYVPTILLRGGYTSSFGSCGPIVYLDGIRLAGAEDGSYPIDQVVDPDVLVGIEVYRSTAEVPPRFNAPGSQCGVLVLWTGARG